MVISGPSGASFIVIVTCLLLAGCQQKMAEQPSYRPLEPSAFFADQRSSRPLVAGTVPRGQLRDDVHFYRGETGVGNQWTKAATTIAALASLDPFGALALTNAADPLADSLPLEKVLERLKGMAHAKKDGMQLVLERGQERFNIYCTPCHDYTGSGHGMIVQRGFAKARSLHIQRLRQAPLGHFFRIMTTGIGPMPSYAVQIPPEDRWAIAAYIRALQLSQGATLEEARQALELDPFDSVPKDIREALEQRRQP
jgi:mono/diheme cytochrome c family protein